MEVLSPTCKSEQFNFYENVFIPNVLHIALAVLRKNFAKLCHCLPQDYKLTVSRIRRFAVVPPGLMSNLSKLPNIELANCTILAGMLRPLRHEVDMLGFCDSVEQLVDGGDSKKFIEVLRKGKMYPK